jgi:valyl-tRNA synthetase
LIQTQLRRLGCIPDWSRESFTMDANVTLAVMRVFAELHKRALVYRGTRMVNWDPKFRTAISDLEVENQDRDGNLWHIRYSLTNDPSRHLVVATTRPETLFGDQAVAVNAADSRYQDLIGQTVTLPFSGRTIPIIADDHADPTMGSGAVKITPAHDFNDYEVGLRHNLQPMTIMTDDAHLNELVPSAFQGLERFAARALVVKQLEEQGLLDKVEPKVISTPIADRSGVVVEPRLTQQWYVDVTSMAKQALDAVATGETRFVPSRWTKVYNDWLDNIQPWCVSRQLWYGHRIPAWYGPDEQLFVAETEAEALAAARTHYGRNDVTLRQDDDIFDTWFSSGLWPFATLGWPSDTADYARYYPTQVLATGFDIIFFWVARMMMQGIAFTDKAPFDTVYIHGLVRDEYGQKMSKTKGNVIDPLQLIEDHGADATRLALMNQCGLGQDIRFSHDAVHAARLFITKFWNAARYAHLNSAAVHGDFDPVAVTHAVNRWMVGELSECATVVFQCLDEYRFSDACTALRAFTRDRFCDWYIEFTKVVVANGDAALVAETQRAMGWGLGNICQLLNPITPFVTETIWGLLGHQQPIIRAQYPDYAAIKSALPAERTIGQVISLISRIRSLRDEFNVPRKTQVSLALIRGAADDLAALDTHAAQFARLANVGALTRADALPKRALPVTADGIEAALLLDGVIDFDTERARLQKAIATKGNDVNKLNARLGNKKFISSAKPEAVQKARDDRQAAADEIERLQKALELLD